MCETHYRRWKKHGTTDKKPRAKVIRTCAVEGCDSASFCRGWCRLHYTRWYETGSLELGVRKGKSGPKASPLWSRFWEKVDAAGVCWEWVAGRTPAGYGTVWLGPDEGRGMAHRASWEMAHGQKIPDGMVIDHLCRNPPCVNPDHLEVVTVAVNTERGLAPLLGSMHNRLKTHCPRGHPYDESNTSLSPGGSRSCRSCKRAQAAVRRAALRLGD